MASHAVAREASGPGPWLLLVAVGAAAATALVVASGGIDVAHGAAALPALALLVACAAAALAAYRRLAPLSVGSLALYLAALATWWAWPLHVALAAAALAATLVSAAATFRGDRVSTGSWRDYLSLTKPRIMTLLLLTGAAGMFVGARGVPSLGDLAIMLLGLALACGGASALNHVLDHDLDRRMRRTAGRPVASARMTPELALEFGLALSAFSFVVLASFVNVLAAVLALFGNLFYVVVYTRWLKRWTPQNIVIGGAAGAVPAVVGWTAATGSLALPALLLFLIVFLWTPPHFWALALLIKRDYEQAGVPMLPVVRGEHATARAILRYAVVLVAASVLPFATGTLGFLYLGAAVALGGVFAVLSLQLARRVTAPRARRLFTFSLAYLAVLFAAMSLDPILLG